MKDWFLQTLVVFFCYSTLTAQAALPPNEYADQIKKSPVKVTAEVLSVKIVAENDGSVSKKVTLRLIRSFGDITPDKTFNGYCLSAGKEPIPGPDQYFYPKKRDVVFVTLNDESFTSYTLLTSELNAALKTKDLKGIEYGCGTVFPAKPKIDFNDDVY